MGVAHVIAEFNAPVKRILIQVKKNCIGRFYDILMTIDDILSLCILTLFLTITHFNQIVTNNVCLKICSVNDFVFNAGTKVFRFNL